jgi:hypothetical protein
MIQSQSSSVKKWLLLLLVAQLVSWLISWYALSRVNSVELGLSLPTPTCPDGIKVYPYMSDEIGRKCTQERLALYMPNWAKPLFQVALLGSFLCGIGGMLVWIMVRQQQARRNGGRQIFRFQVGLFLIEVVWCILSYPFFWYNG